MKSYAEFDAEFGFSQKAGFTLSPLQVQDVDTFVEWRRGLNRYEVGGGKTVVSTAVSLIHDAETTVVIVPPILLPPWEHWLTAVSERVLVYKGHYSVRETLHLLGHRWIVVSQAMFRTDFERFAREFKGRKVDVIIDEAHAIKSPEAKLYLAVGRFSAGRPLQMLTATPTSAPMDCYTYIRLATPDMYRSIAHFESLYVAKRDEYKRPIEYRNLEDLAKKFAFRSIKRTKEELHGYNNPPLYPDTSYDLSEEHMELYTKLLEEQLLIFDDGSKLDATTPSKLYHAMQQIVVNFDHFSGNPANRSNTYDLIDLTIEQTECLDPKKSKLILWTYYKLTSRNVLRYLLAKGFKAVAAYSEVDSAKSVKAFMEDPQTRIGVFQPGSAGAGLNPQEVCWESLFLETSTRIIQNRQAMGRVDRMGQAHTPTIRFGVAQNTVQVTLLNDLLRNDDDVSVVEMTKTSLRALLQGNSAIQGLRKKRSKSLELLLGAELIS